MSAYLVIQLARFGDLIQTKRLISTLLSRDNADVVLCVDASLAPLAEIVYPNVQVTPVRAHATNDQHAVHSLVRDNLAACVALKGHDFAAVYNLNFSPLNFRLASLFDPASVHGYRWENGQETVGRWSAMAMRWSAHRRIGVNLVDFWAGYCPDMVAPQSVNPPAKPNGGGIGVVLAGRESRRSLPVDVLSQIVAAQARKVKRPTIHLLGGPSEAAAGQAVMKRLPADVQAETRNLAGKTDWKSLVDVVSGLDALLTPDTGTMHLAAHLGIPVQAFFLSSAWCFETGPYGEGHVVHQALTDCLPCLETAPCPYDVACLEPFADPSFLRYLVTENADHAPKGLAVMDSGFDALGQVYLPRFGEDPSAEQRAVFRRFLADHLGVAHAPTTLTEHETFAQRIYSEKDWITAAASAAHPGT